MVKTAKVISAFADVYPKPLGEESAELAGNSESADCANGADEWRTTPGIAQLLLQNHIAQVSAVLAVTIFHEDAHTEGARRRRDGLIESDNLSGIDGLQGRLTQFLSHHIVEVSDQSSWGEDAEDALQTNLPTFQVSGIAAR